MKLATFTQSGGTSYVGKVEGDQIYPLATSHNLIDLLAAPNLPDASNNPFDLADVDIKAPLIPRKIICIGKNYAEHAAETGSSVPEKPLIFAKYPTCVIGINDTVTWSEEITQQVDWEGELVVVIGKPARNVSEENAMEHVFGYTIGNDISARDIQFSESQWVRAKAQDTFLPLGPYIVTRDEIPDPQNLTIKTVVNGEMKQNGHTKDMVFGVAYLVSYCSQTFTLEPGDLILTGTPAGVGKGMNPPEFLGDGDTVKVTIDGIGSLVNSCRVV